MDIRQNREKPVKQQVLKRPLGALFSILSILSIMVFGCSNTGTVPVPNQPYATTQSVSVQENQQLQQLNNLTHSSEYSNALAELSKVQSDSSQLATFVEGLPKLPTLLQNVTIGEIQTAVDSAKQIRSKLSSLPPLPKLLPGFPLPPPPPPVKDAAQKLEDARQDILAITEPIAQLPDLPLFIQNTDSLEQVKQRIDGHLLEVKSLTTDTAGILQRLKTLSEKPNVRLTEFQSLCSSSDYQTLATRISQVNGTNSQLVTLVKSLPTLPSTIANIPVNKVEDAVNKAKKVNAILRSLPDLTPYLSLLPPDVATLEALRQSTVKLTDIVAKLPDLPKFISGSTKLEDVRAKTQNYLGEVQSATSHDSAIMQQVNQIVGGQLTATFTPVPALTTPPQPMTTMPPPMTTTVAPPPMTTPPTPIIYTYSLNVYVNPSGVGSVQPSGGQYTSGTVVTLTATPASGYTFAYWSGDASGSSPTTTITMNSNKNIVANFRYVPPAPVTYNLSVSVSPQGGGSVSSYGGQYTSGTSVTLTATPASGYTFAYWSDASGSSSTISSSTITFTINTNNAIIANFRPVTYTYSLSVSVNPPGAGSVSLSPSGGQYSAGTSVTLTSTPATGYKFDSWSGDASGTGPTITIAMNSNKNVAANFTPITYSLSVSINPPGSGSVSLSPPGGQYTSGTVVTATAVPASGYTFVYWSGNGVIFSYSPTFTGTINTNNSVVANFTPISSTPAPSPTTMSFRVDGGPFGYKTLTGNLVQGQRVDVSFSISGGSNNDIYVYVNNPSNAVVAGSKNNRYSVSGQFSFTASVSGSYSLFFDNSFSLPLTFKSIQVTITGGQWR